MAIFPFLFFFFLPAVEIWGFSRVASRIGFWSAVFLLLISAGVGAYLAQAQGRAVLMKIRQCLAAGEAPSKEMLDGVLVFLGGLFFLFPGFISDIIGLLMVFPLTRFLLGILIRSWMTDTRKARSPKRPTKQKNSGRDGFYTDQAEDAQIRE